MSKAPKSEQTIINDPFKATIAGYKKDIEGYKKMIQTQNDENDRLRKHIVLVEYEIDVTKVTKRLLILRTNWRRQGWSGVPFRSTQI